VGPEERGRKEENKGATSLKSSKLLTTLRSHVLKGVNPMNRLERETTYKRRRSPSHIPQERRTKGPSNF